MPLRSSLVSAKVQRQFRRGKTKVTESGCIEWLGTRCRGYGVICTSRKPAHFERVHRLVWQLYKGAIPEGMQVCHHCDNPPCINLEHLFLGTFQDNMADKVSKGRQTKGEGCSLSKTTEQVVRRIRKMYSSGKYTLQQLADRFHMTIGNVHAIVHRKSWKHVN